MHPTATRARYRQLKTLLRHASARRESGLFAVEGPVLVTELLATDLIVECVVGSAERLADLGCLDVPTEIADPQRLAAVLSTTNPVPLAAVAHVPAPIDPAVVAPGPILALVGIADPGNAGTMIRTAEAGGMPAVIQVGATVDLWNPKLIRASAGAVLRLPVLSLTVDELFDWGRSPVVASVVDGGDPYDAVDLTEAVICVGSEAHGLPAEVVARSDRPITIPLAGPTDSLNAAAAAAVLVFAALQQRRALATLPNRTSAKASR